MPDSTTAEKDKKKPPPLHTKGAPPQPKQPKLRKPLRDLRVVKRQAYGDGKKTMIIFSVGSAHGIAERMSGHLTNVPDGGFKVHWVEAGACAAVVNHAPDAVLAFLEQGARGEIGE